MLLVNLCSGFWLVNVEPEEVHPLVATVGHILVLHVNTIYDELFSIPLSVSVVPYCLLNPNKTIIANKIKL